MVNSLDFSAEVFELVAAFFQQRPETGGVATRVVVKGRSHLDESVQKSFARILSAQPHGFQRLVGFKKLPCVEQVDSFRDALFHHHLNFRREIWPHDSSTTVL